jgi:hypothetical protein
MPSNSSRSIVRFSVSLTDSHVERALASMHDELVTIPDLDVRRVVKPLDASPSGSKGQLGDVSLLITAATPALSVVAGILRTWLISRPRRSIKLTIGEDSIELSAASLKAQSDVLDLFLLKHSPDQKLRLRADTPTDTEECPEA